MATRLQPAKSFIEACKEIFNHILNQPELFIALPLKKIRNTKKFSPQKALLYLQKARWIYLRKLK